ncbi:DNA processing protein [Amphibacillus marinus]|uniref:DNA processing protein n=1 Tax=Amphibacillus marinus TaxID=872970 RepID=A0A1H8HTV5_9BACI|nr:DNA-processing protein DprA [Amphibacillus marinus]SEN59563.1 DNA processing protein [Amphibacillus marinus]
MHDSRSYLIYLAQASFISRRFLQKLLEKNSDVTTLLNWTISDLANQFRLTEQNAARFFHYLHDQALMQLTLQKLTGIKVWTIIDCDYPNSLKNIPDPPVVLYGLGKTQLIHHCPALAVVGTRHPSNYAKKHIYQLLYPLVTNNWLIVSGLAKGIDGYAHRIATYYHGQTIAAIAGGFNHPYPRENLSLFHHLKEKHLIISEYPPNQKPERYHFPERNRLISGLSFATLVVEAKERSGSLITADQALEQGREVMAVPGLISEEYAQGCHNLINNGAKLVQNTYDIIEEWHAIERKWCRTIVDND